LNNFSRKAKFDNVKYDEEAVKFHAEKYDAGFRYPLGLACYQLTEIIKMKQEALNDSTTKP
jgi:hypothetical protein